MYFGLVFNNQRHKIHYNILFFIFYIIGGLDWCLIKIVDKNKINITGILIICEKKIVF